MEMQGKSFSDSGFKPSAELKESFKQAMDAEVAKHGVREAVVSRENHPEVMGKFFEELADQLRDESQQEKGGASE